MRLPTWEETFKDAPLGDKRRNKRCIETAKQVENITEKKGASAILRGPSELKAVGRLMNSPEVNPHDLLQGFVRNTCGNLTDAHVLMIEDTSELNFSWRKKKLDGLGPTGNGKGQGFFIHPAIIVEPEKRMVLGLAGIKFITRKYDVKTTVNEAHKNKKIEEKESYKWITAPLEGCEHISTDIKKTIVTDREGDIFDLFYLHRRGEFGENSELLIRGYRNRKIQEGQKYLLDEIQTWETRSRVELKLEASPKRKARIAQCAISYGKVTLEVPRTQKYRKDRTSVPEIYVVNIEEEDPPIGEDPIRWILLTTWKVETPEEALEKIRWYRCRWLIEELFRVLKSGCQVESVKFDSGHALMNWCAMRLMMAIKVMYLRTHRDDERSDSAKEVLTEVEIEVLEACESELISAKSTIYRPPPQSIAWASLLIAIMGGYKATPSAKPYGHQNLWRGLARLEGAVIGYQAALKNVGRF